MSKEILNITDEWIMPKDASLLEKVGLLGTDSMTIIAAYGLTQYLDQQPWNVVCWLAIISNLPLSIIARLAINLRSENRISRGFLRFMERF